VDIDVSKDKDGVIFITQMGSISEPVDVIFMTEAQALKLAYRLMSLARGQGPTATETIDDQGQIVS
jgi:hypothetical protein